MAKERKKKYARYTKEFREMAVQRLKEIKNVRAVAQELGIDGRLLYYWRARKELNDRRRMKKPREFKLQEEINELKRVLAEKTLEIDFFRGALQKIEARRQQSDVSGAKASTTKSEK